MKGIIIAILVLLSCLAQEKNTHAYCLEGPLRTTGGSIIRTVPVYLYATASQTTFLGIPIDQIETGIRSAVATWWEEGTANVRPYYAGRTTSTSVTGRVLLRSDASTSCTRCSGSHACEKTSPSNTTRNGSTIWFETPLSCFPSGYGPWQPIVQAGDGFRQTLTHELGHALGFNHPHKPGSCTGGGWIDTSMEAVVMAEKYTVILRPDDQEGLVAMYGNRCRQVDRMAADATFNTWTFSARYNECATTRPQGSALSFTGTTKIGFNRGGLAAVATDSFGAFSVAFPPPIALSYQPVAFTRGMYESDLIAVWTDPREDESTSDHCSYISVAVSRNGGSSWTRPVDASDHEYCTEGPPTITYDYIADKYVAFLNGDYAAGQFLAFDLDGNLVHQETDRLYSVHTPIMTCGLTFDINNRCLIMYDRNDANGCLAFRKAHTNGDGTVSWGSEILQCFAMETTPALMFLDNATTYPWAMIFKSGNSLLSMVKTFTGNSFTQTRVVATDNTNGVTSAGFGERQTGSTYAPYAYFSRVP